MKFLEFFVGFLSGFLINKVFRRKLRPWQSNEDLLDFFSGFDNFLAGMTGMRKKYIDEGFDEMAVDDMLCSVHRKGVEKFM